MSKRNSPGTARAHYEQRKVNRPVQKWMKAVKVDGLYVPVDPKEHEIGAIPVRVEITI